MIRTLATGTARSLVLPWILGRRWAGGQGERTLDPRLWFKVATDELFLAAELTTAPIISPRERHRVRSEIETVLDFFARRGWHEDPAGYHGTPPPPGRVVVQRTRSWGVAFEHARFGSGWRPHPGEPGRERWLAYAPNRTAHAWLLRHAGAPRPWIVCVPGYRMGHPGLDLTGLGAGWLHHELGLNVAVPVLPFHGPRRVGFRGGDGFLSGDVLDTLHAKAQGVWDVRRLVAWLRREGAPAVALYGISLGAFMISVAAGLEDDIDCVVAGIPAADFVGILEATAPAALLRAGERILGFPWDDMRRVFSVVSPLSLAPRLARERRFLYAATHDRLAPPDQARALWRHWQQPRIEWYAGSHCSFLREGGARRLVHEALTTTGMLGSGRGARSRWEAGASDARPALFRAPGRPRRSGAPARAAPPPRGARHS